MPENKLEVLVGAGRLYVAVANTPMPTAFTAPLTDDLPTPGPWHYVGFTEGGVNLEYNLSKQRITVDQRFGPIKIMTTERTMQVSTTLAQINAQNLKLAYGGGTVTDLVTYDEYRPPAIGQEETLAILFIGPNPAGDNARFYAPQATRPDGASAVQFLKGDKATIAASWEIVEPDTADPFIWRTKPEVA